MTLRAERKMALFALVMVLGVTCFGIPAQTFNASGAKSAGAAVANAPLSFGLAGPGLEPKEGGCWTPALLPMSIIALSLAASLGASVDRQPSRSAMVPRSAFAGGMVGTECHGQGVYEFDPLNFCENFPEHLPWYREAELKHGRLAMLACAGLVVPDHIRFPGAVFRQEGLDAVTAHNLLLGNGIGKGPMWWLLLACGALEMLRISQLGLGFEKLTFETAGDFEVGKFLLPEEEEAAIILKMKELKNGRLAMLAFGGALTQAVTSNVHHFPFIH